MFISKQAHAMGPGFGEGIRKSQWWHSLRYGTISEMFDDY
jgi:hypothetical protein